MTLDEIQARISPEPNTGCWLWMGCGKNGYGRVWYEGQRHLVHRLMYELNVGPIPTGAELDHLCRTTICVNPSHVQPVTHKQNVLRGDSFSAVNSRKSMCPYGHPYDMRWPGTGARACRTCKRLRDKRRWENSR